MLAYNGILLSVRLSLKSVWGVEELLGKGEEVYSSNLIAQNVEDKKEQRIGDRPVNIEQEHVLRRWKYCRP